MMAMILLTMDFILAIRHEAAVGLMIYLFPGRGLSSVKVSSSPPPPPPWVTKEFLISLGFIITIFTSRHKQVICRGWTEVGGKSAQRVLRKVIICLLRSREGVGGKELVYIERLTWRSMNQGDDEHGPVAWGTPRRCGIGWWWWHGRILVKVMHIVLMWWRWWWWSQDCVDEEEEEEKFQFWSGASWSQTELGWRRHATCGEDESESKRRGTTQLSCFLISPCIQSTPSSESYAEWLAPIRVS